MNAVLFNHSTHLGKHSKVVEFIQNFTIFPNQKPTAKNAVVAYSYFSNEKIKGTFELSEEILKVSEMAISALPSEKSPSNQELNQAIQVFSSILSALETIKCISSTIEMQPKGIAAINNFNQAHENLSLYIELIIGVKCIAEARKDCMKMSPVSLKELKQEINRNVPIHNLDLC